MRRISAFTFIELLTAISILSTIVTLLFAAFFQVSNATLKVKSSLEARQELRLLMKIVLDDLQAVQYLGNFVILNKEANNPDNRQTGIIAKRVNGPDNHTVTMIHFNAAIASRFFPEAKSKQRDPLLHEVGYGLEIDTEKGQWLFNRREDFYIDADMSDGGKKMTLSDTIVNFTVDFLEQNIKQANSNELKPVWVSEWDTNENNCTLNPLSAKGDKSLSPCLPLAVRLTMALKAEDGSILEDTMEVNLPVSLNK